MMIITDSASDITKQEALEMNIRIVSLKIRFSDGEFHQNTEEDFSFVKRGKKGKTFVDKSVRKFYNNSKLSVKYSVKEEYTVFEKLVGNIENDSP